MEIMALHVAAIASDDDVIVMVNNELETSA